MIHQDRFLEAMKTSSVSRVVVIDDAFDTPVVSDDNAGQLLDFFESGALGGTRAAAGISPDVAAQAVEALGRSDYVGEIVVEAVGTLYRHYVDTLDDSFDPGGIFKVAKGANLINLLPLLVLLSKCDPKLQIVRVGSNPHDLEEVNEDTHLIFVDFYLDPALAADDAKYSTQKRNAKQASLDRIRRIIKTQAGRSPSIVLTSSHKVRDQAEKFRSDIGGGAVFASRFTFLDKTQLSLAEGRGVRIEADAADALLDIVQSYEFGRALYAALGSWLESATAAVGQLRGEIEQLTLKDFAYLVRFRLAEEGQGLLEYLEWFFGECLLDTIGKSVDKGAATDDQIKALDGPAVERIEGAFDGPTKKIAELYHRVRIEAPRSSRGATFRLGDLYAVGQGKNRTVAAIMTPDCDLIPRKGGKPRAPRLLAVSGRLKRFDAPEASVADFVILDNKAFNIAWDAKGLSTHSFDNWPTPGQSTDDVRFLGTLRPLYSQELQRNVLHDLGRVGLSVAPAIGMTAAVKVTARHKNGTKIDVPLNGLPAASAYVVPSRGGADKTIVIFRRRFVATLLEAVRKVSAEDLHENARGQFNQVKQPSAYGNMQKLFQSGLHLEEIIALGIFLTGKPTYKAVDGGPWCWITVAMEDSLDEC